MDSLRFNPVIRLTNWILFGVLIGGLIAWLISSLFYRPISNSVGVERMIELDELPHPPVADAFAESSSDTDDDGMSDSWELQYGLDPDDPSDASTDFDRDALTALQEFQNGSNPQGDWDEKLLNLGNNVVAENGVIYEAFSDTGHVLLSGSSVLAGGDKKSALWHQETGLVEIDPPEGGSKVVGLDVNNFGVVTGHFTPEGGSGRSAFVWDGDEFRVIDGYGQNSLGSKINDLGDVLVQTLGSSNTGSIVLDKDDAVIHQTSALDGDGWNERLVDLNNYGEMMGTYTDPYDLLPWTFLKHFGMPTFHTSLRSSYPEYDAFSGDSQPLLSKINDYGEFASGFYSYYGSGIYSSFYFYDGDYHSFKESGDGDLYFLDLNDTPQVLFQAEVEGALEYRLASDGVVNPIRDLIPESFDHPIVKILYLNDEGQIFGFKQAEYGGAHVPFLISPVIDSDDDGMSNDWENFYGLNPNDSSDGLEDFDGDGKTNRAEYALNRNPKIDEGEFMQGGQVPDMRAGIDTDGDGMPNLWEIEYGLDWQDPRDADFDPDRDGYTSLDEFFLGTTPVGAPVFELVSVVPENGHNLDSLSFGPSGSLIGRALYSPVNANLGDSIYRGLVMTSEGEPTWVGSMGEKSSIAQASGFGRVGGWFINNSYKKRPVIWEMPTLAPSELILPPSAVSGEVTSLSATKPIGVGVYALSSGPYDNKIATFSADSIFQPLSVPNLKRVYGKPKIHESGAGIAMAKFTNDQNGVVIWGAEAYQNGGQGIGIVVNRYQTPLVSSTGELVYSWIEGASSSSKICVQDEDGILEKLTIQGATNYFLKAITADGTVMGYANLPSSSSSSFVKQPFLLSKNRHGQWQFEFLPVDSSKSSEIVGVNDFDEIVVRTYSEGKYEFRLFRGKTQSYDLGESMSGVSEDFEVGSVIGISNDGSISAWVSDGGDGSYQILRQISDTDGDGAADHWEIQHSFDPFDPSDGEGDYDRDGLSNFEEFQNETDPRDPDTDQDTMEDGWEVTWGLDPLEPLDAFADPDKDQVVNQHEHLLNTVPTGVYAFEEVPLEGFSNSGGSTWLDASHQSETEKFKVIRGRKNGNYGCYVFEEDSNDWTLIPPALPGGYLSVSEVGKSGAIYGIADDEDGFRRPFTYSIDDPNITFLNIPTSSTSPLVYLQDVSADERSVLVYRNRPNNTSGRDILSLSPIAKGLSDVQAGDLEETRLGIESSYYFGDASFYGEVCLSPNTVLGTLNREDFGGEWSYPAISSSDESLPLSFGSYFTGMLGDPEDSYYGYIVNPDLPGGGIYYQEEHYSVRSRLHEFRGAFLDPSRNEPVFITMPRSGWPYIRSGNDHGQALVLDGRGQSYLSDASGSLNMNTVRVVLEDMIEDDGSISVAAIDFPRVKDEIVGGLSGASLVGPEGEIEGVSSSSSGGVKYWKIRNANDFDENGVDDDYELLREELRERYLEISETKVPDDPKEYEQFQLIISNLMAQLESQVNIRSDRDGDGVLDHLDAHPDDKVIDWEKGDRPQFIVVPVDGTEDLFEPPNLGGGGLGGGGYRLLGGIDFSPEGEITLTRFLNSTDREAPLTSGEIPKADEITIYEVMRYKSDGNNYSSKSIIDQRYNLGTKYNNGGAPIHFLNFSKPIELGVVSALASDPSEVGDLPSFPLPFELMGNPKVWGDGVLLSYSYENPGDWDDGSSGVVAYYESDVVGAHAVSNPKGGPYYDRFEMEAADSSGVMVVSAVSVLPNFPIEPPRRFFYAREGWSGHFSDWSELEFPPIDDSSLRASGRVSLGSTGPASSPSNHFLTAQYTTDKGDYYNVIYEKSDLNQFSYKDHRKVSGSISGGRVGYATVIKSSDPSDPLKFTEVERGLWSTGEKVLVSNSYGSFRTSRISRDQSERVAGISSQGWILAGGKVSDGEAPELFYADHESGDHWIDLNSCLRQDDKEDEHKFQVEQTYEMERNGLILAKIRKNSDGLSRLGILVPIQIDNSSSTDSLSALEIMVPDRYRSISLDGRPLGESKPQGEAETDLPEERANVDVYTGLLKYDTSHAYVEVPASSLALQVTQSHAPKPFPVQPFSSELLKSMTDAQGKVDLMAVTRMLEAGIDKHVGPFGANWSSNLSATAVVEPVFIRTDSGGGGVVRNRSFSHYNIKLVDESGRSFSFSSADLQSFQLKADASVDKKAYAASLSSEVTPGQGRNQLVLQKKYGTKLTYELEYRLPAEPLDASDGLGVAILGRLIEVRDRAPDSLDGAARSAAVQYEYPADDFALNPDRLVVVGREEMAIGIHYEALAASAGHHQYKLVKRIVDPRGVAHHFDIGSRFQIDVG